MGHNPVRFNITALTVAELEAYPPIFDDGDLAYVFELDDAFTFEPGSTEALDPGVVLNGPGGHGRWILQSRHVYGALYCHQGNTPQALTTVPALLTCWTAVTPNYLVTEDLANDRLIIQKPGAYQISLSVTGTASANLSYNFHVYQNGAEIPGMGITRLGSASNPVGGTSLTFAQLNTGDFITAYANVASGNGSITIVEAALSIVRMG